MAVKDGETIEWRAALGDDRKVIGDFACYVVLLVGLSARLMEGRRLKCVLVVLGPKVWNGAYGSSGECPKEAVLA